MDHPAYASCGCRASQTGDAGHRNIMGPSGHAGHAGHAVFQKVVIQRTLFTY